MVEAARARGYAYLAISDHSKSLAMAGGLDADRVHRQWEEIDAENARRADITVLRSTEVDILADGRIDFDDELLAGFDWVTASIHSALTQDAERITARVLAAVENPFVDAIGHPTGRMLDRRAPAPIDIDRLAAAAARTGTFLEINAPAPAPRPRLADGPDGAGGGRAHRDRLRRPLGRGSRLRALRRPARPPRRGAARIRSATPGSGRRSRPTRAERLRAAGHY